MSSKILTGSHRQTVFIKSAKQLCFFFLGILLAVIKFVSLLEVVKQLQMSVSGHKWRLTQAIPVNMFSSGESKVAWVFHRYKLQAGIV